MNNNIRNKNIWMFHHYATPPTMSGLSRPYNFGVNLRNFGYNVKVFAASYLHYSDKNLINNNDLYIINNDVNIPFLFIRTSSYSRNGIGRVFNMIDYYKNLFKVTKEVVKNGEKPNLIIASSPHPLTMIAGIKISNKLGVPCICEVRDFWPEVFFMGGRLKERSLLGKVLVRLEHWIYKKADAIVFLKEGDYTYITDKRWDLQQGGRIDLGKCYYINNGVNVEAFSNKIEKEKFDDVDLFNGKFNVVYVGAIRPVNNVGNILDAAKLLKDEKDIQFLIYGDGNQIGELKRRIIDEDLFNVKIKGYIDKKYIPYVLSKSSLNILNYAQNQYNWTRGNSSNKLFEYMASGKPIISTVKMGYSIIDKYKCGFELENASGGDLANAILKIKYMPNEKYHDLCINAKNGAKEFDYKVLTKKLIEVINSARKGK